VSDTTTQVRGMTRLELKALVTALSNNEDPRIRDLFRVIPLLEVVSRRYTGVGFYTKFASKESIKRSDLDEAYLKTHPPEAVGLYPGISECVNFLVWIKNGQVDCLEAACSGSWPEDETQFVVSPFPAGAT
jgi:hypothetical protein